MNLSSRKEYQLAPYRELFPEDTAVTADDLELVTLENVLAIHPYNDLGLPARGRPVVLAEAQSAWSVNIVFRLAIHCFDSAMSHLVAKGADLYGSVKVDVPDVEAYVIYTGRWEVAKDFVLVSTRKIAVEKLLPLYYTRDRVEKVFEIAKQGAKLLPVNVETEATLRGHLLLSFVATVALKMMSDRLAQSKTSLTTGKMLSVLHEHHATVYDDEVVTQEPVRMMREAYEAFGLKCPEAIKRTDVA